MKSIQFLVFAIALSAVVSSVVAQDKYQAVSERPRTIAKTINLSGSNVEVGNEEFYRINGCLILEYGFPFYQKMPEKVASQTPLGSFCYIIKQEILTSPLSEEYRVTPSFISKIQSGLVKRGAWKGNKLIVDNATNNTFDISIDSFPAMKLPPLKHVAICFIGDTNAGTVHVLSLSHDNKKELIRLPISGNSNSGIHHIYNIGRANQYYAQGAFYEL